MPKQMFVNLPVRDLKRSVEFFTALGFGFNRQFTDEKATCMIVGQDSFVMLLVEDFFTTFTGKELADASKSTEVIVAISEDSREQVDKTAEAAIAAGGRQPSEPKDYGFMYQRTFEDPDGHMWEVFHMNMDEFPGA